MCLIRLKETCWRESRGGAHAPVNQLENAGSIIRCKIPVNENILIVSPK